jgi:molybdate transport system regulatory protein
VFKSIPELQPRLRFPHAGKGSFGHGKADLLGYVAVTGSIRSAAAEMEMSYQRAWSLVTEMNELFTGPLVSVARGGGTGGGATLTPLGEEVLARYRRMEETCRTATLPDWQALVLLLRKS